ncbi:hypothetical protein MHU86_24028 [Fragilaria crotonensis]|nr:hypothetical protein MHU86_24028 [Fragilaria crotonensis]
MESSYAAQNRVDPGRMGAAQRMKTGFNLLGRNITNCEYTPNLQVFLFQLARVTTIIKMSTMRFPIQNLTNNDERDSAGTAANKVDVMQGDCLAIDHRVAPDSMPVEDSQGDATKSNSSVLQSNPSTEGLPPKSITLQKDSGEHAPIFGYAQLHYDEQNESIVPMLFMSSWNIAHGMEDPGNRRGRPGHGMTPALFPPLYRARTLSARSFTTVSTLTAQQDDMFLDSSSEDDQGDCAFLNHVVLGREARDYLLKDSKYAHHVRTVGCYHVFRKFPKSLFHRRRKGRQDMIPKERDSSRAYTLLAT